MAGRRFRRIGATFVTVVGLGLIVALCTGEVALVTTHGISMEPRFYTGDLAVITPSAHYRVGEIVGYHSPLLHIVVLHRIVAEHAGLFTFKGDNNSFLDPVRLPASAIEGRLWLHIPHGGVVLGGLRSPVVIGLLAFLVVALGIGGTARRRRNRGAGVGMAAAPDARFLRHRGRAVVAGGRGAGPRRSHRNAHAVVVDPADDTAERDGARLRPEHPLLLRRQRPRRGHLPERHGDHGRSRVPASRQPPRGQRPLRPDPFREEHGPGGGPRRRGDHRGDGHGGGTGGMDGAAGRGGAGGLLGPGGVGRPHARPDQDPRPGAGLHHRDGGSPGRPGDRGDPGGAHPGDDGRCAGARRCRPDAHLPGRRWVSRRGRHLRRWDRGHQWRHGRRPPGRGGTADHGAGPYVGARPFGHRGHLPPTRTRWPSPVDTGCPRRLGVDGASAQDGRSQPHPCHLRARSGGRLRESGAPGPAGGGGRDVRAVGPPGPAL